METRGKRERETGEREREKGLRYLSRSQSRTWGLTCGGVFNEPLIKHGNNNANMKSV